MTLSTQLGLPEVQSSSADGCVGAGERREVGGHLDVGRLLGGGGGGRCESKCAAEREHYGTKPHENLLAAGVRRFLAHPSSADLRKTFSAGRMSESATPPTLSCLADCAPTCDHGGGRVPGRSGPPGAAAAKRSVPGQFAGVMLDKGAEGDPPAAMDEQMALMARSGVESVRTVFSWERIQPRKNGPFDFSLTDQQVGTAASARAGRAAGDALRAALGARVPGTGGQLAAQHEAVPGLPQGGDPPLRLEGHLLARQPARCRAASSATGRSGTKPTSSGSGTRRAGASTPGRAATPGCSRPPTRRSTAPTGGDERWSADCSGTPGCACASCTARGRGGASTSRPFTSTRAGRPTCWRR